MQAKQALLIVDVQFDFCPGGSLAVPDGDKIVPVINEYIKIFSQKNYPIFASRDWHPQQTSHFEKWPSHCVQDTPGAEFHPHLKLPKETINLSKGMYPDKDSYSAFRAVDSNGRDFLSLLKKFGVEEIFVSGLATDYCVKASVLDALKSGFKVNLLEDAVKGVNIQPQDVENALKEMVEQGAKKINLNQIKGFLS